MKSFLSKKEQEELQGLEDKLTNANVDKKALEENADIISQLRYKKFKLAHQALSKLIKESKPLEDQYNLAVQKGGVIQMNLFVHSADGDPMSAKVDMGNETTRRDGSLLSFRKLTIGNWFGYYRYAINAELRLLEQDNKEFLRTYREELRKLEAEKA